MRKAAKYQNRMKKEALTGLFGLGECTLVPVTFIGSAGRIQELATPVQFAPTPALADGTLLASSCVVRELTMVLRTMAALCSRSVILLDKRIKARFQLIPESMDRRKRILPELGIEPHR
jgi:hypothetical protein